MSKPIAAPAVVPACVGGCNLHCANLYAIDLVVAQSIGGSLADEVPFRPKAINADSRDKRIHHGVMPSGPKTVPKTVPVAGMLCPE